MTDNNFLALQYALGLLNDDEKQAIEPTENFNKALGKWQLHLTKLHTQAPLKKSSAHRVWQQISNQLKQQDSPSKNIITTWVESWRYAISGFAGLGLLLSVALFNQTANAELGWDIKTDLAKQQVSITTTTHTHADKATVCTLWVKNNDRILLIGPMPETGNKLFNINLEMSSMIATGEMIISFENKNKPASTPSKTVYQQKWKI